MFPNHLNSSLAYDIAKAMMDGFNRHYQLFRTESARAKHRFEVADWHGQQRVQRERIEFYDLRVLECSNRLEREFKAADQTQEIWQQVKLHYIGLLVDHHQPSWQKHSLTPSPRKSCIAAIFKMILSLCALPSAQSTLRMAKMQPDQHIGRITRIATTSCLCC